MKKINLIVIFVLGVIIIGGILAFNRYSSKEYIAEKFVKILFTSDRDRYKNFEKELLDEYSPVSNTMSFLEYPGKEEYVKAYEKYCTDNCLKNMGKEHLFTYLDFLAVKASKDVICTNVKLNKIDGESSEEFDNVCFCFVADLEDHKNSYSVTGKVYVQGYKNRVNKVNGIIFFDHVALSKYVLGQNIYN